MPGQAADKEADGPLPVTFLMGPGYDVLCSVSQPEPHWGSLSPQFIVSGSLSVAAERNHTSCLVSLSGHREPGMGTVPTPLGVLRTPAPICSLI